MTAPTEPATPARPSCRACGSPATTLVGTKHGEFVHRDFSFWHCSDCEVTFVDPFPGYDAYDEAYYQGRGADPYVSYEEEYRDYRATHRSLEFEDLWRLASGYIARSLPEGPVEWLDFGCGAGGLLKFLAEARECRSGTRSWPIRVSGHDIGAYADRLRDRDGFRIVGMEELEAEPSGRYDVISMIEVVEHLEFPDPVFKLAARLLRPGGLLLVTTGNLSSPVARARGLSYAYYLPEIHVSFFNPRAMEHIFARHGLEPVRFRYDGAVRFKVIKTLRSAGKQRLAQLLMAVPGVVRLIDALYGTSRMPCARKPR
jgi:2-polyprenyl-3-methyl-5-hydroxy-6-metoxy-1,4-benzoquinol methylase